jgi:4-alpha-glucanotransferase
LFLLDAQRKSTVVAGVPPDYFSATGQLWGNPIYDWPALKATGYRWWVERVRALLRQVDVIRLDHFRGFVAAWHIPAAAKTAEAGEWVPGPGRDLFDALKKEIGDLPFVAEDLGLITPEVIALRDALHLPGMRILQFAFDGGPTSQFLPHNFDRHTVAYTGTHDNDTTAGWFASLSEGDKKYMLNYVPALANDPPGELMRLAWSSIADLAIAPLQDVLGLGTDARMNRPGTADGNWTWRVTEAQLRRAAFERLAEWTWVYGRTAASPARG